MVPDKERGVGLWLKRQREKEGYPSQRLLLEALARQGIRIHASAYATLESHGVVDTPAKRKTVETIAKFYGVPPPDLYGAPSGEGMTELVRALTRQTEAMEALVQRLDTLSQRAIQDGVADALREVAALQAAGELPPEPPPGQQP